MCFEVRNDMAKLGWWREPGDFILVPHWSVILFCPDEGYKKGPSLLLSSRSRVVSTERTILSPFTKEYRVFATTSGIRLFLEGCRTTKTLTISIEKLMNRP